MGFSVSMVLFEITAPFSVPFTAEPPHDLTDCDKSVKIAEIGNDHFRRKGFEIAAEFDGGAALTL